MTMRIEKAQPHDKPLLVNFLEQADLPTEDLPADLSGFVLAKDADTLLAVAGLERFGPVGLLRSVVVHPAHRGRGLAALLIDRVMAQANAAELQEVYLITTTADHYFNRHGFAPVDRAVVPQAIQLTRQFRGLCPSSAVIMKRLVTQETV